MAVAELLTVRSKGGVSLSQRVKKPLRRLFGALPHAPNGFWKRNREFCNSHDHLYQIDLGSVNAFLLKGDGLTLIDTGLPGSTEKMVAAIRKGGKNPDDLRNIVLTHWHPDHAGNAAELQRRFK